MSENNPKPRPETEAELQERLAERRNELHKMYHTGIWGPMYWKQFDFPDAEEFEED